MTNTSVRDLVDRALLPLRAVDGALHDRAIDYVVDGVHPQVLGEVASFGEAPDHSQILHADSSWQQPAQTEDKPAATEQTYTTADKDDNNLPTKTEQTVKRKNKPRKYGKKRNMAIVPAEDTEQRTNRQEADSH